MGKSRLDRIQLGHSMHIVEQRRHTATRVVRPGLHTNVVVRRGLLFDNEQAIRRGGQQLPTK